MKRICFILCFLSVYFIGKGQTITINNAEFDVSKPYGTGSTISLPVTLSSTSCFDDSNVFNLYLSDQTGNFAGNNLIGSFTGFFTTYVNGLIPAGTPAGSGYKLKITSTSPIISAVSPAFSIATTSGALVSKVNPQVPLRILSDQLYFGWCSTEPPGTVLDLANLSSTGASVSFQLKNGSNGTPSNPTLSANVLSIPLQQTFYTLTVKADSAGILSTKSYFLINTPNILGIANNGQQKPCFPDSVSFQIPVTSAASGGIGDNFPGMRYQVFWNDGTTSYYKQCDLVNANGVISHLYTKSSCSTGNPYSVTPQKIYPYFPVGSSQVNQCSDVGGISTQVFVYSSAKAKFSSPSYGCINTAINFSNNSDPGQSKSFGSNTCNSSAYYTWFVDGAIVYSSATPESTPPNLSQSFSSIGTHTVRLLVDNLSCAVSDTTRTICIEPVPVPNFTMNPAACVPTSFTPVNTTNSNPCRPMTFSWSILDSLGNNTVNTSFYTISDPSAFQPVITILKSGKYILQLSVSNSCSTVVNRQTILTGGGTPLATLPPAQSYCGVKTIDFGTDANHKPKYDSQFGNSTVYNWSVTGGTYSYANGTSATSAYPQITFNDFATYTVGLTYVTNCGTSAPVTQQITFKPIPTFTVPSNQIVCGGLATSAANFISSPAGANFNWTNNNASIGLAVSGSGNIGSYTTVNQPTQQVATITATPTLSGCTGSASSFTITVNTTPPFPTATTVVALCQNTTASALTATSSTGNTLKWYDATNTLLPSAPTPSTTTVGTTTYYVSQVNTLSNCEGAKLAILVTVNPATVIDTLSTKNPSACQGTDGVITLKGLVANTAYTLSYTKNGTVITTPINANASGNYIITGLSAGAYTNITITRNNCPSNTLNPISLADPSAPATPVITSNSPICSGARINLSTTPANGVTFIWSGPNGFSKSGAVQTIPNATIADSGRYSVVAVLNGCTSGSATVNYVVNETPDVTAANNNPCSGTTLNFTATSSVNGVSYSWSGVGFPTANTTQNPSITNATSALNGTYTVTAATATCNASASTTVTIKPTPNISSTSSTNPTNCGSSTGTIVLNGLIASTFYDVAYTKNGVAGSFLIQSNTSGVLTIPSLAAGIYSAISVTFNGCTSNFVGPFTLTDPNVPTKPTATSNSPICSGTNLNLNAISDAGTTFNWVGPNGFTSTQTSPSITNTTAANIGTYKVVAVLNSCVSDTGSVTVAISQSPVLTVTSNNPCSGNSLNLTASSSVAGVSYAWSGPNGFTSALQNPSFGNASTLLNGTYNVVATIGACSGSGSTSVVVTPTPVISGSTKSNPTSCGTATGSITLNGLLPNTNYTVNYNFNGVAITPIVITSNASGDVVIAALVAGTYTNITASLNGCPTTTIVSYTLSDPSAPVTPTIAPVNPICSGATLNLFANSITDGVTYTWTGPNAFTSTTQNPSITNTTLAAAGTYTVKAILNSCTSSPATVSVVINETPVKPTVGGNSPVCESGTINLTAVTVTTGSITYSWSGPNAFTSAVQNPTINNALPSNAGYYKVFATNTTGNCVGTADSVNIIVNGALTNTITSTPPSICAKQSVTIIGQTPVGGNGTYAYQWQQSADNSSWTDITGATLSNITFSPSATVYVRRVVASSTCTAPSNAVLITVQPSISNNNVSKDTAICLGTAAPTLVGSLPIGGNNTYAYQWQNSTDGGATWLSIASATAKDYLPPTPNANVKYRRIVTSSLCTGSQADTSSVVTITVNPLAKALYTYTKDVSCSVFDIAANVQNIINPANGSYQWYANNTLIGTGTSMPAYSITNGFDSVVIKLKALSLFGCSSDSLEHKFFTSPSPIPSFTVSDSVGCGPLSVSFTNTTTYGNLFTYNWNFGTGATATVANPSGIVFPINPTHYDTIYNVTLSALTACKTVTATKAIRVKSKPQALFTPNKSVGCSPLPITFNNTSRGNNMTFVWNFGDGSAPVTTSSSNAIQHTYSTGIQDTFNVKLIATNECGSDTLTYNIIVSPNTIKLDFAVNATDVSACLPSTVHFINNTSGATSFNWDFGDGNILTTTKNIDTVTHVYISAGTFTTKLTATNGCSDTTDYEQIKAFAKPIVKFTASPSTACLGDSILFVNQTDTATGYTWRFGNGTSSSLTNPTYVYNSVGTYHTQLIAVRQYPAIACSDSTATTINVVAKLKGSFKVSDSVSTCVPFKVVFTNLSLPSILTTWDYGDGIKDTGDLVQHIYTTSNTFVAKMTAVNAGGCTYETTKNIGVNGPTGTWIYDKGLICAKKSVQFQVNALNADSLRFNFGDGTSLTTTSPIVNHTYTQSGNYLPSVQLLSGASCYVSLQGVDTIKIDKITVGFTTILQKTCGSTTVGFTDSTRSFYGVQTWQWNYGDGTPVGTTQNTQHTYTAGNTYNIQLIVVGKSGCSDTAALQLPININNKPKASIITNVISCANQQVNYTANITSQDSVVLNLWKFATGASATGSTTSYVYTLPNTYTAAFITGTINGCFDTAYNTITVNPSPSLAASADVTICKGASTQLLATGSNNVTWLPATNISCTTCTNPSAFPLVTTAYVASSTNGFGCTSTDTVVVTVIQPFTITITPSDSICVGQSTKLGASGAFSYTWSPTSGLSDATIQNPVASPLVTTTYQVTGKDQYNCFTSTASVVIGVGDYPVVNLGQDQVLAAGSTYTFTPSVMNGPIASWLWTPATNLDCSTCPSVMATAKNNICYVAQATNIYHCASTDTVCIKVFCESSQVFIPNAFMPGTGSGKNDILMVRGSGIKLVKSFRIYNRWGQVVFERANFVPNDRNYGWDGLIQGKPADTDVYIYTCEVVCENDTPFIYKGNVAVIR
jgi:PKD repeat protein